MSAYRNDFHIEGSAEGQRLELAIDLLAHSQGVIVIDNLLALRAGSQGITCEVIARGTVDPRLQIESAQTLLSGSTIGQNLPAVIFKWIAVEDYGTGTIQVWPRVLPKPGDIRSNSA